MIHTVTCRDLAPCLECQEEPAWNRCNFAHYMQTAFAERYYGLCFQCAHWRQTIDEFNLGTVIVDHGPKTPGVTSGVHKYEFNPDAPLIDPEGDKWGLGFSGRLWQVDFFDSRSVRTNNLWHGGEVPERFYDRLPVNATLPL